MSSSRAWNGEVAAKFEDLHDEENEPEAALGIPLLEIYSPVRQVWSGDIIAVAEFYAVEDTLASDLAAARRESWLVVAGIFVFCGLSLYGIVRAGGRTIEAQRARLLEEAGHSRAIAKQNAELRQRAVGASARAAAQTERTLRQVSADLHDGPAQYLALAALRLDRILPATEAGRDEAEAIRGALNAALTEIRALSRGLSLPDLEPYLAPEHGAARGGDPSAAYRLRGRAGATTGPPEPAIDQSAKICAYRFLQESLSNVTRHAPGMRGPRRRRSVRRSARRSRSPTTDPASIPSPPSEFARMAARVCRDCAIGPRASAANSMIDGGAGTRHHAAPASAAGPRRHHMSIRVVLADDHPIFREGLVRSIDESDDFEVVGEAASAAEAVALVAARSPDVALARHLHARQRHRRGGRDRHPLSQRPESPC